MSIVDPLWIERHALVARIGALHARSVAETWPGPLPMQEWLATAMGGNVDDLLQLVDELNRVEGLGE